MVMVNTMAISSIIILTKGSVILTKRTGGNLVQYEIDVSNSNCIESVVHTIPNQYNDADAIVFDTKGIDFLYLKSDFNPNDHGNELIIMEFNDNTDPEDGHLSEYSINYRDFF